MEERLSDHVSPPGPLPRGAAPAGPAAATAGPAAAPAGVGPGREMPARAPAALLLLPLLLGAVTLGAVLFATRLYGPGLSPDSVRYISVARDVAAGRGLPASFVSQPPLYPLLLAWTGRVLRADPLAAARPLGAALAGLVVLLAGLLAVRRLGALPGLAAVGAVGALVSRPLMKVFLMAWTEPFFIALILAFLLLLEGRRGPPGTGRLLLLAALAGLATVTRYVGVTLIATGVLVLLLTPGTVLARLGRALLFGLVALLLPGLWVARNLALTHTAFGPHAPAATTLEENLVLTARTLLSWYAPPGVVGHSMAPLLVAAVAGLALGVVLARRRGAARAGAHVPDALPLFSLIYLGVLLASSTTVAHDRVGDRLLAPLAVPLLIGVLAVLRDLAGAWLGHPGEARARGVVQGLALALLLYPLVSIVIAPWGILASARDGAGGYNTRRWRESETVAWLARNPLPPGTPLYSNVPEGLYLLAGIAAEGVPARGWYNARGSEAQPDSLAGRWPAAPRGGVAWFDDVGAREYLFTPAELGRAADLSPRVRLRDGTVYDVTRRAPAVVAAPTP